MTEKEKPWTITCPACQDTRAYQGLLSVECPNLSCRYHTQQQEDAAKEYEAWETKKQAAEADAAAAYAYGSYAEQYNAPTHPSVNKDADDDDDNPYGFITTNIY